MGISRQHHAEEGEVAERTVVEEHLQETIKAVFVHQPIGYLVDEAGQKEDDKGDQIPCDIAAGIEGQQRGHSQSGPEGERAVVYLARQDQGYQHSREERGGEGAVPGHKVAHGNPCHHR